MSTVTDTAEYVKRVLAAAPPLNEAQRTNLAELLRPVRKSASDGEVTRR